MINSGTGVAGETLFLLYPLYLVTFIRVFVLLPITRAEGMIKGYNVNKSDIDYILPTNITFEKPP